MAIRRQEDFFQDLENNLPALTQALLECSTSCGFPIYSSLDIRDAGWKVAAVDVNLFPGGFNNLSLEDHDRAAQKMRSFLAAKLLKPAPWTIAVVPEAHTNNQGYLENLAGILEILKKADVKTKLLWSGPPIPQAWKITTRSGKELNYLPAEEALANADAIILNHDLSGGIPKVLQGVNLPTFPSPELGWYKRKKSKHEEIVDSLLCKLEKRFPEFDPWYFGLRSEVIPQVDFRSEEGLHLVAQKVDSLISNIQSDYEARNISEKARAFVKNDSGTYGMGVLSVESGKEILEGGRSLKNKMRKGKESVDISQVIVQEAVPTQFLYQREDDWVAGEPVIYMVNGSAVGGFFRIHEKLGPDARWANLNQVGGLLEPLNCKDPKSFSRPFPLPRGAVPCEQIHNGKIYAFVARLHAVAAGLEECL